MILKICGITNPDDSAAAIAAGATAIGFNFWPRSPRYIDPERAAEIVTHGVRRVGVFVNESPARVEAIAAMVRLDVAQLHGDESASDYPENISVWKGVRVDERLDFSAYVDCPVEALLLDGPAGSLYGGSGESFSWSRVPLVRRRIILAGGLDASNVATAIRLARPWGVDACSRLESAPGKKDHRKMMEFLEAAQEAFRV
jgi:phosphoribosylanthranilate isomerase